jgi:hypothetical protein
MEMSVEIMNTAVGVLFLAVWAMVARITVTDRKK